MDDFRKYATKHLGMNSLVLDDVIKSQAGYLNPYILEERQLNVTQLDVFSRLMMDRIIFLGTQIDDYTANTWQAQLLYLDSLNRPAPYLIKRSLRFIRLLSSLLRTLPAFAALPLCDQLSVADNPASHLLSAPTSTAHAPLSLVHRAVPVATGG